MMISYCLIICLLFKVFKKGNGSIIYNYLQLLTSAGSCSLELDFFQFSYSNQSEKWIEMWLVSIRSREWFVKRFDSNRDSPSSTYQSTHWRGASILLRWLAVFTSIVPRQWSDSFTGPLFTVSVSVCRPARHQSYNTLFLQCVFLNGTSGLGY